MDYSKTLHLFILTVLLSEPEVFKLWGWDSWRGVVEREAKTLHEVNGTGARWFSKNNGKLVIVVWPMCQRGQHSSGYDTQLMVKITFLIPCQSHDSIWTHRHNTDVFRLIFRRSCLNFVKGRHTLSDFEKSFVQTTYMSRYLLPKVVSEML